MWLWCRSCGTKATSISFPRAYKHVTRRTYQETFDRAAAEAGLSPELPLVRLAPTPVLL